MYARMVTAAVRPGKLDEAIQLWKDSVAPTTRQQTGFISARMFVDRAAGKIRTLGLWQTEADFLASVQWNQAQIDKFAGLFAAPPTVEGYEFVAEVSAE
jgi:quinol monooxygenase YgiN